MLTCTSRRMLCLATKGLRRSSSHSSNSSLHLVAELRKRTTVTIQKAREALIASDGDLSKALDWLERDRISTGQQKVEKVGGRFAGEGLIGISVLNQGIGKMGDLGVRAAMVELNCETDFVGRNELFRELVQDLAFTAAFITEPHPVARNALLCPLEVSYLRDAPLMVQNQQETKSSPSKTVSEAIRDVITAVGENISIRRAMTFVHDPSRALDSGLRASSYVHGEITTPPHKMRSPSVREAQGRIGALVAIGLKSLPPSRLCELLRLDNYNHELGILERALARQIVGMNPATVRGEADNALYSQPFDVLATSGGQSVSKVLSRWAEEQGMVEGVGQETPAGLEVIDFLRWEVGERL